LPGYIKKEGSVTFDCNRAFFIVIKAYILYNE